MHIVYKSLVTIAGLLSLGACANLDVVAVKSADAETHGVRYYRPWPYILVSPVLNADGEVLPATTAQIIWLPNVKQEFEIKAESGIGSVELNPTLTDGWNLTALGSTVDSKTSENISAVAELLTSIGGIVKPADKNVVDGDKKKKGDGTEKQVLPIGLYRLKFDAAGNVCGLAAIVKAEAAPEPPAGGADCK